MSLNKLQKNHSKIKTLEYRYDILIDNEMRSWLIEVNSSPSLSCSNALDKRIKDSLIRDTLNLVRPIPFDRTRLLAFVRAALLKAKGKTRKVQSVLFGASKSRKDLKLKWNLALSKMLNKHRPRKYGVIPENLGQYVRLCPGTKLHSKFLKLLKESTSLKR